VARYTSLNGGQSWSRVRCGARPAPGCARSSAGPGGGTRYVLYHRRLYRAMRASPAAARRGLPNPSDTVLQCCHRPTNGRPALCWSRHRHLATGAWAMARIVPGLPWADPLPRTAESTPASLPANPSETAQQGGGGVTFGVPPSVSRGEGWGGPPPMRLMRRLFVIYAVSAVLLGPPWTPCRACRCRDRRRDQPRARDLDRSRNGRCPAIARIDRLTLHVAAASTRSAPSTRMWAPPMRRPNRGGPGALCRRLCRHHALDLPGSAIDRLEIGQLLPILGWDARSASAECA